MDQANRQWRVGGQNLTNGRWKCGSSFFSFRRLYGDGRARPKNPRWWSPKTFRWTSFTLHLFVLLLSPSWSCWFVQREEQTCSSCHHVCLILVASPKTVQAKCVCRWAFTHRFSFRFNSWKSRANARCQNYACITILTHLLLCQPSTSLPWPQPLEPSECKQKLYTSRWRIHGKCCHTVRTDRPGDKGKRRLASECRRIW